MEPIIVILIILAFVFAGYYWSSAVLKKRTVVMDDVIATEAGPLNAGCTKFLRTSDSKERALIIKLKDGRYINTSDYLRLRISGTCMTPRNILNGEEWLAKPYDGESSAINPGDVLLIYIKDKNMYKIREVERVLDDKQEVETFYYNPDGSKQFSSRWHRLADVRGVVKYAI